MQEGRGNEARTMLAQICSWLIDGFDTGDSVSQPKSQCEGIVIGCWADEEIGGAVADLLRIISGDQLPKISTPRGG